MTETEKKIPKENTSEDSSYQGSNYLKPMRFARKDVKNDSGSVLMLEYLF